MNLRCLLGHDWAYLKAVPIGEHYIPLRDGYASYCPASAVEKRCKRCGKQAFSVIPGIWPRELGDSNDLDKLRKMAGLK